MRLCALMTFFLCNVSSVHSILADEAYHVDYHQALLGIPQSETTFFHRPSAASSASLLYTVSDKAVLGAVNPKDGSLVWRQLLAGPLPKPHLVAEDVLKLPEKEQLKTFRENGPAKAGLLAEDGSGSVVSYYGSTVSAWDARNGKLIWQSFMPEGQHVKDARLLQSQRDSLSSSSSDVVVVYGTESGTIIRLDGSSGTVIWKHADTSGGSPRFLASTEKDVYYASEQSAVLGSNSLRIASLRAEDGHEANSYSVKTDEPQSTASCSNLAFTSWLDRSSQSTKVNILGSTHVHTLPLQMSSGDVIEGTKILTSCGPGTSLNLLMHVQTRNGAYAEIFHIDSENAEIQKAYSLPFMKEKDTFAISNVKSEAYFVRITDSEIELYSFASENAISRWPRREPSFGGPTHAQTEVVSRGQSSFAIRVAELSRGGEWNLMRDGDLVWSRPEMLADVVTAAWADDFSQEALAHDLDLEGHEGPLRAYIHRLKRHLRDLQYFPSWLQQLPSSIVSGLLTSKSEAEKGLLGSKSLIVATSKGQYLALDPAKAGSIKWKTMAREFCSHGGPMSLYVQNGIVTSFVSDLGIRDFNATNGQPLSADSSTTPFIQTAIVPGSRAPVAYRILRSGAPEPITIDDIARDGTYLVTRSEYGSDVQGWMVGHAESKLWSFSRGAGFYIANVVARPAHDPVSSIGKVLGDRSVLYKYLSRNLILITSVKADSFTIDLLDSITGTILYSTTHHNVDTRSPIPSVMSENWFTYSFFGNEHPTSPSKSHQLVVVELYESSIPNDRGPLGSSTNHSSFESGSITKPHIITQSFITPHSISHMSVTQTAQGITSRQLLCTLPTLNAIIAIPRYLLDPRRPVERDPTPQEEEEGLIRYSPVLELDPRFFLTHAREVIGIEKIISTPTLLESTGLVFAFGLDVFGTSVTPSKAFDVLGKGFNKISLILTVVALAVGTAALAPMVRKKLVERAWRM